MLFNLGEVITFKLLIFELFLFNDSLDQSYAYYANIQIEIRIYYNCLFLLLEVSNFKKI